MGPLARALGVILIVTLHRRCYAITKNFVNSSMPEMRPTFVVNFDMATVICQHSADPSDLHLHQMSILCDGKPDCYKNPAMHDESFPYCEGRCNSTCSGRGACLFDGSRGQCYCNAGFHGPECELIDNNECEDKPCHWLAHCQNTLGSYYCTCFPGFHGNGHECSDIDECSSGIAHCPEYSSCVNLPGTYFCNCSEGFQPLGLPLERCADIDECEQGLHSCVDPLMCQNEVGSYRCVKECSEGYRLVNGSCIDIDECSEKLAECDKRASCTNTIGGYKCTCEEGFAGNGRTCSPVNDCSQQEGICDRHAFCLGSLRMCICQAGYIGDGLSCYDVNECGAKVNPCEGQSGNRCVNIDGGYICCEEGVDDDVCIREKGAFCSGGCGVHAICYNETCQCMDGFEGDPRVKCDDVNECENDKQCAGVGEWCVNMIGGYICCDPESKEDECKAKRSTTSTNDSTTTSELDHEVKASESSYGEIITQNGGSLLIKNVGQPEAELTTAQPAFASTDSSAAEKTTAGKDEVYPTTLLTDLTTSAIMAFTTLVTQLPEIPAGEEGNAAIHREIDEATAAPKTATITSSVTESTQTATAGETNEPLPTTSEKKSSKTAKAPFITETMSKTAEMSSKATATNTSEAELMQITASRPIEEMRPTSEESAKERDTSFGEKRFTSTPASSHRSTEREEEKNGTQNGKGPEEGHNLAQQRMISTTNEPETVVATSLTSLEPTATSAENEQGEKAKYIEGLPTVEQEMISQTTQHSAMKPEEENTTSEQSSEATEAEVGTENSTPAPDSREKVKAEITTKTKTTGTSEIEASTKGVEIDEAMTATKTSESSMSEATTDEERSSEEEDETTLATSTFAGETRSETTVPEDEEEESSTASAEQQGQTSLNPLVKPTQELPRESSEKESSHSEQKEISSTTEVTVSIEVTTTEQDKQTKEASSEQHNEGSDTSASESITTDDKLIVTDATPDASELHSTSSPATTTTTAVESSSITPPEEEQESRRTGAVTIMPTEIESSSTIRGVQETKTLEHKIEDITTTKPAGEYEVTEVDENALIAKLNEQTLSKNGSFTKIKAYTTIEENEHSTTLGPEEGESPTIKDESTQSSTKQIPVSKSSTTQEAAGERTAEAEQTATGVGSYASVKPDGETPLTTYYPHETNESSVKSKEVTEPKADEEVRSTEQPDHGAISTGGEKEMALAAVTASELYTTISKERDGNFENEINTTAPTSESEPPGKPSPKSDNSYEKIVAGGKTSEPPEEEITRKPVDGEQGKEVVLEVVTTTEVSGAEVKTERSEESTTPILEKSTIITKPVQESDKEKKMNQLEDGHEAAQPTSESASVAGSEGPSTKLSPERFAPLSGASTQSAESEISTFTSPSRRADESQPSDDGGTTASLETTSIERTLAVFSDENVTAAAKVETTVHSDESNLPVEKYSNETTSRPKIIGEGKYESTLRGSSDGTTPSVKTVKALPTEAYGISSASETPSTPETGLEIIWVTASSIPEASSSSTSQERGTTAVVLSPSTSTVESIVLRTDHSTKVTTHLLGSSMQSTTVVSEEKASVTPESSSTTSDTNGFAKTEAESSTTVGTKTIKGETEGEGKITSSTPAGSFGSAEVSSSTANFVTDIPESKETNEGDGGLVHVTSATTETTSTTNEEEGSGEVEEVTGKPHTAHISTAVPNEEQPVEGYRSISLLETTKQPWNRSTEGTIITESHGNTTGQAPRTAADKLHSLTTPDIEQRLHTGNEGMLESSTVVSGPMTEKTITGSAEEERKEGKEADSTNAPIKLSTFETAHFTIGSNGTEETVSKEDSVPRTPLLIVTTPSIEETTIRIGPTMRHGSELFHTTALRTSTSPSSSVGQHGSVVAETTEMIETSGTYTVHAVIESSSTPFAESPAKATATVTPSKETFGKSSEITVTLSPSAEAANEEKQPFTLPSTKIPSTEASQSSSSSGKTETYGPTGMSTTTEIEEKVPKKGVSEPSKVIPPDQQTLSTPEYGHEMFHVASTSTEQPKTTILIELPASGSGRKEAAAKKGSGTTENGVGNTHLNATNIASKTNALHPISEQGKFTVIATPEAATALPVDQFTNIGSETTEVTASTTATEDKLSTMPVQEETTIQSESSMMTSSIPIDSSEVGENVPKEKGIPHTPTITSTSTFSSTGEKQINEVTFGYGETTKSTSKVTHSIDKPDAEKGFQSTEETPESTTLDEIAASSVTTAAMSTTTEDSSTSSPSIEITERTVSTTLSSTNEASGETEVTTLLSASESEVPSAEETTATTDASVIRTTLEETVSPKTAKLPERWRTTKETFSLKTTTEESSSNASLKTVRCHSSDHCGLDAYCERRSGACRCFAGFDGAPPQTPCVDVNECERHLDDCHSTARCSNFVGGYTCLCETGYRKNNDGVCVDIDECSERAGSFCHPKATCANLPGSYSCQCIAGYVGDGHTCLPLDKRHCTVEEWEKMDCGRNHLCLVDEYGNGDCDTCKSGFIMRDGSCSDIDECADAETNVCHADAICKNLVGSFTCQCQPGFKGDGFQCIDVDECQQNPCHPHANCINFPGSYTCKCPDGWDGDGTNECINPLDEECRNKEAVCKRTNHTSCLSVRLGELISVCECDANYRYNNETEQCEDIDECEENRHSCDPSTSVCVNTDGGYICECAAGYEGTGGICVDVDECERGLAGCNVAANCENHIGSVGCKCAPGYTGDGIDCTPINVRTSSSNACTQDWIHLCRIENKTCHIDDEDVPQCGSCLVGHQPVGGQCLPINGLGNCADPNKNDCDPNADCIDVHPGRHFCTCKVGYIGDGRHCDDVDECSLPGVCDAAADCHNTNGSFTCVCQPGYSGNGFKCVRSTNANGEPNCHLDPSMCHKKANCLLGGTCKCINGYVGDGITSCEPEDIIKSSSKEQTYSTVSHSSESEKSTSVTSGKTESTTASALKETQHAETSETSTTVLTATSVRGLSKLEEPETISTTTESAEKTFASTTKLPSTEDKKLDTTTEKSTVPASSKVEATEAKTIQYTASSSEAPTDTTRGRGGIALPTEGTDQPGNPYEGTEAEIISNGPPGTSPISEKDLEGITSDKKHETSHTSIASSISPSVYIHTHNLTTEMPEKLPHEEELRRGSEQMQTKKTAGEKEAKLTEEAEKAAEVSAGDKYTGEIGNEITGGKATGGDASSKAISKTSEESDKLTHGLLSGGKAMMGIGVKRTDEVARGGAVTEETTGARNIEGIAEKELNRNGTGEAGIKGERTVIKIAIGGPEGTLRERAGGSLMSTKMNGRLDSGKGTAKMTGEVHSGAKADKSQVGIDVAKTTAKTDEEVAQNKHGNESASLSEGQKIEKEQRGGIGKLAEEKGNSQHIGEGENMKESGKEGEKASGTKPSEEQTERPHYRTHFIQKCTSTDTSPCHENAKCDVSSGHCVCKNGYYGDGYSACTKITQDCISDADACDTRAVCDVASRRCKCLRGYVGDGLTCFPDVLDCVLRPNLCSDFASCIDRRCVCNEGYTGDGSSCVSLEPVTDCSKCDVRAECVDSVCKCRESYFGNGGTCIADPADCVHYPGLCHRNALCDDESRRCQCLKGFLGDGLDCSNQKKCLNDSTVCHEDADCLPSGVCQCRRGFTGNGILCNAAILINAEEATSAPKFASIGCEGGCHENEECFSGRCHCVNGYERDDSGKCVDIDECSLPNGCHPLAICVNLPGSHACTCPDGYRGDGKICKQYHHVNNMAVDCEMDGMTLVLTNESELFDGRIFVRGQTENPYCSKKLSSIIHNGSDYRFTVPFAHCNVRFEEPDTFAVTVVVQRHPMFITQTADAYDLRCTYPVGSRQVMSHVNVSEMTTADTIVQTGSGPICSLTVTNDEDEVIDTATVGQVLRLALSVQPNDTYAILPRNCFAINLETGERYSLTDQAGCAIDTQLFPEWVHKQASLTTATFRTFKWPDSSMIRFQCDCSACVGSCPKVNCDRRREAIKRRRLRFRYARGIDDKAFGGVDNELERSLVSSAHAMAFSHAVHVDEDEEERRAQREVDNWKYQGFTSLEPFEKNILVERICVRAMWIGVSVLPLLLIVSLLGALSLLWKRKSSRAFERDVCKRTIYASENADNASSYLKF
uniref:Latent-transforming growth factor beta-binding protein 1 n=1 Tax=Ascaris suum TaxID=6253 RepID=F1KPH9_ASCSU